MSYASDTSVIGDSVGIFPENPEYVDEIIVEVTLNKPDCKDTFLVHWPQVEGYEIYFYYDLKMRRDSLCADYDNTESKTITHEFNIGKLPSGTYTFYMIKSIKEDKCDGMGSTWISRPKIPGSAFTSTEGVSEKQFSVYHEGAVLQKTPEENLPEELEESNPNASTTDLNPNTSTTDSELQYNSQYCGNGICDSDETYFNCRSDCPGYCGDGICQYGEFCAEDCVDYERPSFEERQKLTNSHEQVEEEVEEENSSKPVEELSEYKYTKAVVLGKDNKEHSVDVIHDKGNLRTYAISNGEKAIVYFALQDLEIKNKKLYLKEKLVEILPDEIIKYVSLIPFTKFKYVFLDLVDGSPVYATHGVASFDIFVIGVQIDVAIQMYIDASTGEIIDQKFALLNWA